MSGVRLDGLGKRFGDVVAVRDLDLEIRDGEFLVLLGPSGCGKTTTLRMIAGLEAATSGRVLIGDEDVTDLPPRDRDIAMVFQNYALYPHMSVLENLSFGLRMRRTPKADAERRVRRVAESLGIEELLPRRPAALSGGQRQRVALGRAIVREPAVFLFDEPLSNLDARLRVRTRAELVRLHRELDTTMVYVTHDQTEAMTMGQRIAILDGGRLQQVGTPLDVYDRPANVMVAGFIGSPPMNLIDGAIRDGDDTAFEGGGFEVPLAGPAGPVVLGVRPEHLRVGTDGERGHARAEVLAVEPLGSETLVYCKADPTEIIARIDGRTDIRPGEVVPISVDAGAAHLFDAGSGDRL